MSEACYTSRSCRTSLQVHTCARARADVAALTPCHSDDHGGGAARAHASQSACPRAGGEKAPLGGGAGGGR
eukprot:2244548-Prymnesium_polylepis.1